MNSSVNQSMEPTGGNRSCPSAFLSQRRLPPVAHSRLYFVVLIGLLSSLAVHSFAAEEGTSSQGIPQLRYERMRPGQIRAAITNGLPLLMPVGVLEYHGQQNPVGVDALLAEGIAKLVAKEVPCVLAPTQFYGFSGEWVGGISEGEIHIGGDALYGYVKPILKAFYNQGWRKIYVICHHQGTKGVTMLSYQRAASEAAMEYGLYLCPDTVDLGVWDKEKDSHWARDAGEATPEEGERIAKAIVAGWKKELTKVEQ